MGQIGLMKMNKLSLVVIAVGVCVLSVVIGFVIIMSKEEPVEYSDISSFEVFVDEIQAQKYMSFLAHPFASSLYVKKVVYKRVGDSIFITAYMMKLPSEHGYIISGRLPLDDGVNRIFFGHLPKLIWEKGKVVIK